MSEFYETDRIREVAKEGAISAIVDDLRECLQEIRLGDTNNYWFLRALDALLVLNEDYGSDSGELKGAIIELKDAVNTNNSNKKERADKSTDK